MQDYSWRRQDKLSIWGGNTNSRPVNSETTTQQCHINGWSTILLDRHQELLPVYTTQALRICLIEHYKLKDIATKDSMVYVEIQRGMYGLPQAGLLAQELLEKRLKKHGFTQSNRTPGLWTHKWRPIQFTLLVVDDFGVKYVGEENLQFLIGILKENYEISIDRAGSRYIGITMD